MTWRRPDGSTYREADKPCTGIERVVWLGGPPQAPRTPVAAPEPPDVPIDPIETARERLAAILERIKQGEFGAFSELPAALANARKERS